MADLPERQQACLDAIKEFMIKNGYAPSKANLAEMMGISTDAVSRHLDALELKGVIKRDRHVSRSIQIIKRPDYLT